MKKIIAFLIIACFSIPQFAFAGAWTLPKNTVGLEQYMKVHWAKEDFGPDGDRRRFSRDARSWGWGMASKIEYGLLENLTLMGSMEYKEDKYKEYARPTNWGTYSVQNHGITNVDFGARLRLLEDPVVLSGQIKTSIYIPYDDLPLSDVAEAPELHDRNNSVELRGLIGKYFDTAMPFYVGAEYGYRFKDHDVCNDIPFFIEVGCWPLDWLLLKTEIDGYWSHDGSGTKEEEYAIWRIGPSFQLLTLYDQLTGKEEISEHDELAKKGQALNLELQYGNTIWGRNTTAYQEIVAKISARF